ncbi:MAG: hypothetical protein J6X33_08575 [Clostridiales bacterium]|nr:hypothetical protein [Clostridiales bacterium]
MGDILNNLNNVTQEQGDNESRKDQGLLSAVWSRLTNRYFVLSFIYCVFGIIILVMTTKLQFSGYQKTISEGSKGVSRQYNTQAPRGDIYDASGVLLASTSSYNTVMIANSYMEDHDLNAMCLELSYLFDEYYCSQLSSLDDYFVFDKETGKFTFVKEEEDIRLWQSDTNLFALDDYSPGIIVTFTDNYVKLDPNLFFLYLRNRFSIDNSYTEEEAYRIVKLRYQIFQDNWSFQKGTPVPIADNVPDELIKIFDEQNYHYKGIVPCKKYARTYSPWALYCCHVLGYVGKISEESYATLSTFGYTSEDMVGKGGVERQMERYLHGAGGIASYNVWTDKGEEGMFVSSDYGIKAVPGAKVTLTIDSKYQRIGTEALKDFIIEAQEAEEAKPEDKRKKTASSGAFVMMDVNTGAVLGMGSYPNYDPNDFLLATYGDKQAAEQVKYYLGVGDYKDLKDYPVLNRAVMSQYAPGSTFKPITALSGLENGKITPHSNTYTCVSPIKIGGWPFKCLEMPDTGHGALELNSAMATSCNIYFMLLGVDTGIDNISAMAYKFGLGVKSGIDLPGEISGVMSSRETKRILHKSEYDKTWFPADTAQASIGQFDDCFTILQLCRYTAGIATNKLVTPYVVDSVVASDGQILYKGQKDPVDLGIDEDNLEAVRNAMRCVVTGTYRWPSTAQKQFKDFPDKKIQIVCKTGTAETGYEEIRKEYSNGLFICYAPKDDPKVAVAIVVENGEWGASTIIIAKKLLAAYFSEDYDTSTPVIENNPVAADFINSNVAGMSRPDDTGTGTDTGAVTPDGGNTGNTDGNDTPAEE